ncbi:MAG: transglutaminase family protein [Gammaproteobacteria bacterium]
MWPGCGSGPGSRRRPCIHHRVLHSPLVFDLIDTFNGRSIGGCTYHVHHAGGRGYDTFPVSAYEAEGRRISRYWGIGQTQGPIEGAAGTAAIPQQRRSILSPWPHAAADESATGRNQPGVSHTLDLRRPGRLS